MKLKRTIWAILVLVFLLGLALSGCNNSMPAGGDAIDDPEITLDYLSGEYADQLVKDGADELLGSIEIKEMDGGRLELTVHDKVIVESADYEEGYYIADKNHSTTAFLDSDTGITYIKDKDNGPQVITVDELVRSVKKDASADEEELYQVYVIGDQALLVLAKKLTT